MTDKPNDSPRPFTKRPSSDSRGEHRRHREDSDRSYRNSSYGDKRAPRDEYNRKPPMGRSEKMTGATESLIELDHDLMKLLVKRAKLVARIREGKEHASGASAVIAEKAVRRAWEAGATSFSRDPRFARQLFDLLQDVQLIGKNGAERDAYNLSPANKPVTADICGTPSSLMAQMYISLAAATGKAMTLDPLASSDALISCIKSCTQAGASIAYDFNKSGIGHVVVSAGDPMSLKDKTIFFADGIFSLYFFSLISIKETGSTRLSGNGAVKEADLTSLRHLLPLLGARFTNLVPRSKGLPASIEASGDIPKGISVPANFPFEGVCALLLAPLFWGTTCSVMLEELPASIATAALAAVDAIFQEAKTCIEIKGSTITYYPQAFALTEKPNISLDPVAVAYQLALPAFAGGSVTLQGEWPAYLPSAHVAEAILSWAGISLSFDVKNKKVTAHVANTENSCAPYSFLEQTILGNLDIPDSLLPLALALAAKIASTSPMCGEGQGLPIDFLEAESDQFQLAESMLIHLNMTCKDGYIRPIVLQEGETTEKQAPWFCPDGYWGAAYALCSFIKKGLKLTNPAEVSSVQPLFWDFFNGLPTPKDPALLETKAEENATITTRRRVIVK